MLALNGVPQYDWTINYLLNFDGSDIESESDASTTDVHDTASHVEEATILVS